MRSLSVVSWSLLSCLMFVGCSSERERGEVIELDLTVKTDAHELQVDTIPLREEFVYANRYFVYQDSILVVVNKPVDDVPFIELRNLNDNQPIGSYVHLGKGPGEMLIMTANLEGNILKMSDAVLGHLAFMDLDAMLRDPKNYRLPPFEDYHVYSYGKTRLPSGRLVFENPYCFNDKNSGIRNDNAKRLLIGDSNTTDEDFGKYTYQTRNSSQGNLFINPSGTKLVYASLNLPEVEIYDTSAVPLRTILGPDGFEELRYTVDKNGATAFKGLIPYAYLTYCCNDDYFYLVYNGELINFQEKSEKDFHTWIFQFDWDGNFIDSYYYDNYVNAISISSSGRSIYATARDQDNMPFLVKLSGLR